MTYDPTRNDQLVLQATVEEPHSVASELHRLGDEVSGAGCTIAFAILAAACIRALFNQ